MSLYGLTSIHAVDVYPLTQTKDAMGGTVESLGTKTGSLRCRVVPLSGKERTEAQQRDIEVTHGVQFPADPSLTLQTALVYGGKVLHVREIENRDGIGWSWLARCEHLPQVEIGAP